MFMMIGSWIVFYGFASNNITLVLIVGPLVMSIKEPKGNNLA